MIEFILTGFLLGLPNWIKEVFSGLFAIIYVLKPMSFSGKLAFFSFGFFALGGYLVSKAIVTQARK